MDFSGSRVIVTGADGFIGSHLVEALLREGCDVKAFVHYNSFGSWGWLDTLPRESRNSVEVFAGDVRDPNGVRTALQGRDVVFHLAALIGIPFSYHSPDSYVETNFAGRSTFCKPHAIWRQSDSWSPRPRRCTARRARPDR